MLSGNKNQLTRRPKKFAILNMSTRGKTLPLEEWQRLRTQVFWCYDGAPPFVAGVSRYRTPNYSAWLVRRGKATLYGGGRVRQFYPGDWAIVPPPGHERLFTEDIELLSIHFRISWSDDLDLFTLPGPVIFAGAAYPALERAVRRLLRLFQHFGPRRRMEPITRELTLAQYVHFQTLAGRFALSLTDALADQGFLPAGGGTRPDPQLGHILARLRDLPLDRPWNSAATARSLSMSTGHFNRVFRQQFGQTPRRYFDTRRLEHAKQSVVAGNVPIKEVAAGLGFSSAVFCRWFRQAVGASPTLYRHNVGLLRIT